MRRARQGGVAACAWAFHGEGSVRTVRSARTGRPTRRGPARYRHCSPPSRACPSTDPPAGRGTSAAAGRRQVLNDRSPPELAQPAGVPAERQVGRPGPAGRGSTRRRRRRAAGTAAVRGPGPQPPGPICVPGGPPPGAATRGRGRRRGGRLRQVGECQPQAADRVPIQPGEQPDHRPAPAVERTRPRRPSPRPSPLVGAGRPQPGGHRRGRSGARARSLVARALTWTAATAYPSRATRRTVRATSSARKLPAGGPFRSRPPTR